MANDKFGVLMLNPTKKRGLEWFSNWKNGKTRYLNEGDYDIYDPKFFYSCGQPNCQLQIDGTVGVAVVTAFTDSARLFVNGPWINTEMTVYVKGRTSLSDVQLRSRSNHETTCGFGNYLAKYNRINIKTSIEVEPLHPIYQRHLGEVDFEGYSLDKWSGFKQITRNTRDNKVKVEAWFNPKETDQSTWRKLTEYTFDGTNTNIVVVNYEQERLACVDKGDMTANDINKGCLWRQCGQLSWIRINDTKDTRIKDFSVREIAPL